jgi:autotransporter-associated beta strand protein
MKNPPPPQTLSQQMMHVMRRRLRLPVILVMLFANFAWSLQGYGQTHSATGSLSSRVIRLTVPNSAATLRPGMSVSGGPLAPGTYITQVLSGDQILVNLPFVDNFTADLTFGDVDEVPDTEVARNNYTKNNLGKSLVYGKNALSGIVTINQGTLQLGGVSANGRNWFQDLIDDNAAVRMANDQDTFLNFASNTSSFRPFERIGSLGTTNTALGSKAIVNLSGGETDAVLAVGGDNSDTLFRGNILGDTNSWLIKEGSGTMVWQSDGAESTRGNIRVESGTLEITGNTGLFSSVSLMVSNQAGANLKLNLTAPISQTVNSLEGGGFGSIGRFSNGTYGALSGNYLSGTGGEIKLQNQRNFTLSSLSQNVVYSYGGIISGGGNLIKAGANVLELLGDNTYTGKTVIEAYNVNNTVNTLRLGVYGTSSGVGALESGGHGHLPSTTRLEIVAGSGGFSRDAVFDLNGATQTVSSLVTGQQIGARTVILDTGTLTINTVAGDTSGVFTGNFLGRGTINVQATVNEGASQAGWELFGSSDTTHRGSFNVLGGIVTLGNGSSLGDRVHLTAQGTGRVKVDVGETVGSLSGNGRISVAQSQALTLRTGPVGGAFANPWSGTSDGFGGLTLGLGGSIRITTPQNYTGATTVNSGSVLYLDYGSAETGPKLLNSALVLNGGSVFLSGESGQTITNVSLGLGSTTLVAPLQSPNVSLHFTNLSRGQGGVLQVRGNTLSTDVSAQASGIMGGYMTHHTVDPLTDKPLVSWATRDTTTGKITSLNSYSPIFGSNLNTDVTTLNTTVEQGGSSVSGLVGSLRFNQAAPVTMNISGLTTVQSGGILITPNVGPNEIRINGLGLAGGSGGADYRVTDELIIHQHNTRAKLVIDAPIVNASGASRFTKVGQGTVVLTRNNNYSGQTSILGGVLELADSATTSERGTLGSNSGAIQNFGYLVFNRGGGILTVANNITGSGVVRQNNTGEVILSGALSTYTGSTQVIKGKLGVASPQSLGSTDGLTSVSSEGTLELRGILTDEPIQLKGGKITSIVGSSTLSGSLTLTQTSTLAAADSNFEVPLIISGRLNVWDGKSLNLRTEGLVGSLGAGGKIVLTHESNKIGNIHVGENTTLQVGQNTTGTVFTGGSVGRGTITLAETTSNMIVMTNNSNLVLGAKVTGKGNMYFGRNTNLVYLTADNDYTGQTVVGGGGTFGLGLSNLGADLRVGNDTYTGSIGTGALTVQAGINAATTRYSLLKSGDIANNIFLNSFNYITGTGQDINNARHATFFRSGLGSLNLTGIISAGSQSFAERSILQTDAGGKLTISNRIVNGASNRLNIVNSGFAAFNNPDPVYVQDLWGVVSGGGSYTFRSAGTINLKAINTFSGSTYIKQGIVVVDDFSLIEDEEEGEVGTSLGQALHNDLDVHVGRGGQIHFNYNEIVGAIMTQRGSTVRVNAGALVTLDDGGVFANYGRFTGDGTLKFAPTGTVWVGLLGDSDFTNNLRIGSGALTTVRINNLANIGEISSLGKGDAINLGDPTLAGEARLEYIGLGGESQATNRPINLLSTTGPVRIAGSGKSGMILNGDITNLSSQSKILYLHGQTTGNTINGAIMQGAGRLALNVNTYAANNDMYGPGHWILTNPNSNFSGNVTIQTGILELAGSLGDGTGTNSVLGDLTAGRVISLGVNNVDGRRFDLFTGVDIAIAGANIPLHTGTLLFNDPEEGTAVLGRNITYTLPFSSTTNPGAAKFVNNGNKVVIIEGTLSTGASGNRDWYLDGTNDGPNTLSGIIRDPTSGNTMGIIKQGTGRWRLESNSAGLANEYLGATIIARGTLELAGGFAVFDNNLINLRNEGSDGSAEGGATLRILNSETIGGLTGAYGTTVELVNGSTLTIQSATQFYNGKITGDGNLVRTNNDGAARNLILTNLNTYTGSTTITKSGSNTGVTSIYVRTLANGGEPSSIGASSSAASNLILNVDSTTGGLLWQGTNDQSTDRLFTIGAGANALYASGQVFGDYAPAIQWTNAGAIEFLTSNTNHTLVLRGTAISSNTLTPQINDNGSGVTSVNKLDAGMWVLANANNYSGGTIISAGTLAISNNGALGSGGVSINAGAGVGLQLRGNITVNNELTHTVSESTLGSLTGDNTWAGNIVLATGNFRLSASEGASLNVTGNIIGTSSNLIKLDRGTLTLSGNNSYTGITNFAGGSVILNYDANNGGTNTSKLNDSAALLLGFYNTTGSVVQIGESNQVGNQNNQVSFGGTRVILSGGSHAEVVSATTLSNGGHSIERLGGSSATLQMKAITRAVANAVNNYGTIDFSEPGIATTSTYGSAPGNVLATSGANTLNSAYATVGQTTWATTGTTASTTHTINGLNAYSNNAFGTTTTNGTFNTDVTSSFTTGSTAITSTLRFNSNSGDTVLTIGDTTAGTLQLISGGILVTKNVTDDVLITGPAGSILRRTATTANLDTVFHHHGQGLLTLDVIMANNSGAQALTKTGSGTMVMTRTNTFTGRVNIQQGVLQVGDGTPASASATLGGLATGNPVTLSDGATLRYNVASSSAEILQGVMTGGGTLHLASTNQAIVILGTTNTSNANWVGNILVEGGTLRVQTHNDIMGNVRSTATIGGNGTLDFRMTETARTYTKRLILQDSAKVTVTNAGVATNALTTLSGVITIENTDPSKKASIDVSAGQILTISNLIRSTHGFTKLGDGLMNLTANQFEEALGGSGVTTAGVATPNSNPTLRGQVVVAGGELRLSYVTTNIGLATPNVGRSLGATGVGNETIIRPGASLNLFGQSLNYGNDEDPFREIIHVSGTGNNGMGALRNSNGLGGVSHIVFDGDATISGGGFFNGQVGTTASATVTGNSRLVVSGYDTNRNYSNVAAGDVLAGNYDRQEAIIDGRGANLTIVGNTTFNDATGTNVTFRDVTFASALNSIIISEGTFRIDQEAGNSATFQGLRAQDVTNGIRIAYGGPTLIDHTNASLGLGPNVGSRLNFFRTFGTTHSVNITMDGVTAKANAGTNYIDIGTDATIPNPRIYLSGQINLLGDADRNIIHIDAATLRETVAEQGNLTGNIQSKLIINGQLVGTGGFTKTGLQELRLTGNNTFTGEMNILRSGAVSVPWQDNTVTIGLNSFDTLGDAEGWSEWGVTLSGLDGRLSGTSAINLQRRGMITLDNTNRLDQSSQVTGGNNNDRIHDAASINFDQGWLRVIGGAENNMESLATTNGAKIYLNSGTNAIELLPQNGLNTTMTLNIGEISRSAGSVLQINNLDSTSKFGSLNPNTLGTESVQVLLQNIGNLQQSGRGSGVSDKKVVIGLFGGIMPHEYLADVRQVAYNNANAMDYLAQGRMQQALAASHFMTWDSITKILRPLDDSEYFVPTNGLMDTIGDGAAGKNVNLLEMTTIARQNMSINSLRFGPLSDSLGDTTGANVAVNPLTTLTSLVDAHNLQLLVDGTLSISSGMISSAYFTTGNTAVTPNNTGAFDTLIAGGTLNFGTREAIINNQNAVIRATDGTVRLGNLEIRSIISGSGGLLKTGQSPVFLDGRNTYTGVTTVSNGTLFLRNGRHALGASGTGNGVVIEGNGSLSSGAGIQVGRPDAYENILIKALQSDQYVMRVDNDLTNWYSHLTVDNIDKAGQAIFTPIVRLDGASTAIFNGNFYGGNSAISQDVVASDSRILAFESLGDSTFIFRGQFGDKSDANGNAITIADSISTRQTLAGSHTNENEVLQVRLAGGNAEANFIMEQQYNAVGRLTLFQGNLLITYDPEQGSPEGTGFWTNSAMSKIGGNVSSTLVNAESMGLSSGSVMQGFIMDSNTYGAAATSGAAATAGVSTLFLTKPDQHFNMSTWSAIGGGLKWVGGLNESGTVYFGNPENSGTLTIVNAAVRLYSRAGGIVEFDQRMVGSVGTAPNNPGIIKTGRGTVVLKNSSSLATGSTSNFEIAGGKLVLDHAGANVALVFGNNAFMNGGVVHAISSPTASSTTGYAATSATNAVLNLRVGSNTELIAEGRNGNTMTVNVGNININSNRSNVTRIAGSSLNFVESTGGIINLNFNELAPSLERDSLITWATYSNSPRQALDFAMAATGTGRVTAFARPSGDYVNPLTSWSERQDISEFGSGFTGTLLAESLILNTLRFDTSTASTVALGQNTLLSLDGGGIAGGIMVSSNTGTANKFINGGYLSAYNSSGFGGSIVADSDTIVIREKLNDLQLIAGLPIAGNGIPPDTFILSTDSDTNSIRITRPAQFTASYTNLSTFITSFTEEPFRGDIVVDTYEITNVTNVEELIIGMRLVGEGIQEGTVIAQIDEQVVTISQPLTATATSAQLRYLKGGTVAGSFVIRGVPVSRFTLVDGMPISGQGIPVGAYIESSSPDDQTITMTVAANATVPDTTLSTSTPEIMIHHYGQGTLTVGSTVTGNASLTIAGPMTTLPELFNSTGVVKLTGNNSYSGSTVVAGGILEISDANALGINPTSPANGHLILNGGTLRWIGDTASLGNRGVAMYGNGGVIDVVKSTANLMIGDGISGTLASLTSLGVHQGDLIKIGAGSLTLTGNNASFQGLLDVREGTLIVMADSGTSAAGTITPFGTSRTVADGTILRTGTNVQMFLGNGSNSGDFTVDEYLTFEGDNIFTYGGLLDISANIASTLPVYNLGNRRPLNLNGTLDIRGTTTFDVTANGILRFSNNSGYVTGSGNIIKDGQGQLHFRSNIPDWTGSLEIKQGSVIVANQADALGTGYASGKTIILGSADRQDMAELLVQQVENTIQGWLYEVNNDIEVVYNPAQTKRIGIDGISNATQVNYNGDITLNDSLILFLRDTSIAIGGEQSYVNFNGRFRDGATTSGNLLVQLEDNDVLAANATQAQLDTAANNRTQGRGYGYAVLNADNSGWTGDVTISSNSYYSQDITAILRLGHNRALTAANDVRMNFNSILQAGGRNVTIGNLSTYGGDGAFYGDAGTMSSNTGSSEIIENAGTAPATLTITQTTPASYEASWDAFFRDGTLNSQFFAPGANLSQPSAALNITKAGNGWATLTLDNDYSGTTIVQGGILQVGRNGIGDTGATASAANAATLMTRVLSGATIAGTGTVQGRLTILAGGTLQTGDSAGQDIGTLIVNGNAIFASGSAALMQVRAASYNNPGALTASDDQYVFWRDGVLTDNFSSGLSDLVTSSQHDMLMATGTINWAAGTKITISSDGYTPKAGDIIRVFNATAFGGSINVGPELRSGGESIPGLDLILFALGGNLLWDVSYFNTHGILMVVESDVVIESIPPPVITQMPMSNQSQTEPLAPGTSVTLTAMATTTGNPEKLRYQWILNGIPVDHPDARQPSYTFNVNFNTKGVYDIAVTNEGGTTLSPSQNAVSVLVNDVPDILFDTTQINVAPGSAYTFDLAVGGQSPFEYQWLKDGEPLDGQTNKELELTDIQESDQGLYSVVVTNVAGTATSGAARLNVLDPISSVVVTKNPQQVYLNQTVTLTSTVVGEGTFTYQWKKGTANINGATGSTFVIMNATAAAAGNYSVVVTSSVNTVESNLVNITLNEPLPAIITPPQSRTVLSGAPLEIRVDAAGLPVLRYTWRQNNRVLPNAATPVISIDSASLSDGGTYVVEVANTQGKISTAKDPFVPAEIVVVDSSSQYLPVAPLSTATLTARVGMGTKTQGVSYQWNRVFTREVVIPSEGDGEGEEDGEDGEDEDNGDTIVIEDYLVPIVPGEDPRITGADSKVMKISQVEQGIFDIIPPQGDEGRYRCVVTGPDGVSVTGSEYDLRVFTAAPEFTAELNFPSALIGRDYSFMVPIDREDRSKTPEKITASGLPPGLSIDPFSGLITGRPSATKSGGYKVRITLANKHGKVTREGILTVDDLLPTVTGTWVGLVERDPGLGDNLGGRLDLTVTTKATFTGKFLLGGSTYSIKGPLDLDDSEPSAPSGKVFIKRKGKPLPPPLELEFTLDPVNNTIASGTVTDGNTTINITEGWRMIHSKVEPANTYTGYYTMAIGLSDDSPLIPAPVPTDSAGSASAPLGAGYATFTVAADGKLKMAGKLPDGEKLTVATFIGPDGEIALYQHLYKRIKSIGRYVDGEGNLIVDSTLKATGGSVHGKLVIDDKGDEDSQNSNNTIGGTATWVRPASPSAKDRAFRAGFGFGISQIKTPLEIIALGGRYDPPAPGSVVLGLSEASDLETPNARIEFFNGGDLNYDYVVDILEAPFTSHDPSVNVVITKNSKILVPKDIQAPAVKTTVKAVAKTGRINGSFVVTDFNPRYPLRPYYVKRTVKFEGVIINEPVSGGGTQQIGVGYFMLPQLPNPLLNPSTTDKTSPIYSGRFILEPLSAVP